MAAFYYNLTEEEALMLSSIYQGKALRELRTFKLNAEHFKNCDWFDSQNHVEALKILVVDKKLSPQQAIKEISTLSAAHLDCIIKGFNLNELKSLNEIQTALLMKFNDSKNDMRDLNIENFNIIKQCPWLHTKTQLIAIKKLGINQKK